MSGKRRTQGFTLAELLVVVAIIGVLVAVSIPIFTGQLEKSRRAVDMANARNIKAVLSAGMTSGDIAFTSEKGSNTDNDACIAIVVKPDGVEGFASGNINVYGKSFDNTGGLSKHERIKAYIENNGLTDYKTKCHDTSGEDSDGWNWYAVFLYYDGTMRIASAANNDYSEYRDDTFERHAQTWKTKASSNIEKAMGN